MDPIPVIGAGIAGLAVSLALARAGLPVHLLERENDLSEGGAAVQLSPNAVKVLDRLGLLPAILPLSAEPGGVELIDGTTGAILAKVPLGAMAKERWGAHYLVINRRDLQSVLLDAVKNCPGIDLNLGMKIETLEAKRSGVIVRANGRTKIAARAAIIADGVHSALAAQSNHSAPARFTGYIAWRTMLSQTAELPGSASAMRVFLAPHSHSVVYPLLAETGFNTVVISKSPARMSDDQQSAHLSHLIKKLHPELRTCLAAVGTSDSSDRFNAWPVFAHSSPVLHRLERPVLAIGDAAHAMPPFAAQGAAMALEDAVVTAAGLAQRPDDPGRAFAQIDADRRPRLQRARRRGELNRFAYHADGSVAAIRNMVLTRRSQRALMGDFDWLYGWTPPDLRSP